MSRETLWLQSRTAIHAGAEQESSTVLTFQHARREMATNVPLLHGAAKEERS
jgi:CRISPR/Cas system CMR subunit Cmr4 (Cas7 group RAMP superfamily)